MSNPIAEKVLRADRKLCKEVNSLSFSSPIVTVYNPLDYAWPCHRAYIKKYSAGKKKAIFFGMNPGPWGMAQVGLPFGEISMIRDWVGIEEKVGQPEKVHPKRPIDGFACTKSEVSGRRLWGLFAERFGTAEIFFKEHLVLNYCPLSFMAESGANITPDKIRASEGSPLLEICDGHLQRLIKILEPEWCIGVGNFVEKRLKSALGDMDVKVGRILHPSPASPAANNNWSGKATEQLQELGIWDL